MHTLSLEDPRATAARPTFRHRYAGEGAGSLRAGPNHWHSAVLTHPPGQDCGPGAARRQTTLPGMDMLISTPAAACPNDFIHRFGFGRRIPLYVLGPRVCRNTAVLSVVRYYLKRVPSF